MIRPETSEISASTGLEGHEGRSVLLGSTEVSRFESTGLTTSAELVEHLRETVPLSHLENCPGIRYEQTPNPNFPLALGIFDTRSHEITIHGPAERFIREDGGLYGVVSHELGHNVHQNLIVQRPDLAMRWQTLHNTCLSTGQGFVSSYAATNVYEDFAESYKYFVVDPDRLAFFHPQKYELMKEIFSGREYQPAQLAYWTTDSSGNSIEVTHTGVYDLRGSKIGSSL